MMIQAIRKAVPVVTPVSVDALVAVATSAAFMWLLAHGSIRPLAIYLLELFLAL